MKMGLEIKGQILHCYASGDGALHFTWSGMEHPYPATGRPVKRWHVLRYLRSKEGRRLAGQGWKPYFINGFWQLVRTVVRKNKNTLCVGGEVRECYTYTVSPPSPSRRNGEIWSCDFKVWAKSYKELRPIYGPKFEVKNLSIRAVLLYFLNHEKELARADEKGVVAYA